jgi:hypothetical protein
MVDESWDLGTRPASPDGGDTVRRREVLKECF